MAITDIDIEDYIDEISDYYLIKELKRRANNKQTRKDLQEAFKELQEEEKKESGWVEIMTILDKQKQEWVNENWERIEP